jgi:protein TonB
VKAAALDAPWEQNEFQRWLTAAAVVCAVHLLATFALLNWPKRFELSSDAPPAVIVDLAPLAVAPDSKNLDVAPGPEMMQAQPKQQQQQQPKPEEKTPVPNLLEKPSEVEVPAPVPEKQEQKKQETQKAQEQKKDQPKAAAPQTTAAPKLNLQKADRQAAPTAGSTAESQAAIATWRGAVVAHLNRFKRFPSGAVPGTAVVAFSIDIGGRVTGARLVSSSGNSAADADAVAMVWRANPVPAPPPSMGGNVSLSVPVRYRN